MTEQKNIRNFCIIAHIDHGKSTLSDRLLEFTHTVEKRKMKEQLLDQMDLERERGITIKLQPVRMNFTQTNTDQTQTDTEKSPPDSVLSSRQSAYILNLIDTPGHVDFNYEVSRSLAAVEGAVLLVDATKGVQAQTLSNLYLAIEQGLEIIPVVNKIDLPNAEVEKTKKEIIHILGCKEEDILSASGKTGDGVEKIVDTIIEKIPSPKGEIEKPLRALIFDSKYDTYKGVVAYVRIIDGQVKREEKIIMMATGQESSVVEVGYFKPQFEVSQYLYPGDIGYIATGLKDVSLCRVGDTITNKRIYTESIRTYTEKISDANKSAGNQNQPESSPQKSVSVQRQSALVEPLPGYKEVKPMVYASFYPIEGDDYTMMRDALDKLKLNDAAFIFEPESNAALGKGFRCGFLGLLHLEIFQSRLEREYNISPVVTTPSVVYKINLKGEKELVIHSPVDLPDPSAIEGIQEPFVKLEILTPSVYLGSVMELMNSIRSTYKNTEYLDLDRILLTFEAPLTDILVNFHDNLKSASSGFASMSYDIIGYQKADLIKLDILIASEKVEALSRIVPRERAHQEGKSTVEKLKDAIPRQNFVIPIQAAIGGKVIARETVKPFRKDVISKLYGGDVTRKRKLLEKQKKGKKKMKNIGKVKIPSEVFLSVLRK